MHSVQCGRNIGGDHVEVIAIKQGKHFLEPRARFGQFVRNSHMGL